MEAHSYPSVALTFIGVMMNYRNTLLVLVCFGLLFAYKDITAGDEIRAVTVSLSNTDAYYGEDLIYKVKVENTGNVVYTGKLTIEFHEAFTYVSSRPRAAEITGKTATWQVKDLAVGADETFSIKLSIPGNGQDMLSAGECASAKADVDKNLPVETVNAASTELCHSIHEPE